jgi:hypothetical protein
MTAYHVDIYDNKEPFRMLSDQMMKSKPYASGYKIDNSGSFEWFISLGDHHDRRKKSNLQKSTCKRRIVSDQCTFWECFAYQWNSCVTVVYLTHSLSAHILNKEKVELMEGKSKVNQLW